MSKLSINSLCSGPPISKNKKLSIDKLAPLQVVDKTEEVSINALIMLKQQRKKRKLEFYSKILRLVYIKMKDAAKLGNSELMFEIPPYLSRSEFYKPDSYAYFLKTRFSKIKEKEKVMEKVKITILTPTILFLSW